MYSVLYCSFQRSCGCIAANVAMLLMFRHNDGCHHAKRFRQKHIGTVGIAGNCAPLIAAVYLLATGQFWTLPVLNRWVLAQMVAYRFVYM